MRPYNFLGRAAVFVAGSVIGGLALAFVIVFIHPQLLLQGPARLQAAAAHAAAPAAAGAPGATDSPGGAAPSGSPRPYGSDLAGADSTARAAADTGANLPAPAALPDSFAAAVRRAAPAVVNISTRRLVTEQIQPSVFDQLFGDLQPFYRHRMESALGSGVIVDSAGHVVTNNHVIDDADTIMVYLADGRVTSATVVGRDPDTDLALLSIKLKNLPVMPLGRSDQLQVGDTVLAIGDPLGLGQTVTHGIVSATERKSLGVATFENFIQTDAAINAGNSGGALVDTRGELIGINTAVLNNAGRNGNVEGIGFAIPVNLVRGVMQAILAHGRVIRGWVGILPEDIDDEQAQQLGLAHGGVVITNMYRDSPAVDASVRIGDIVTAVDGKPVQSAQDTLSQIAAKPPGSNIVLRLLRGRGELNATMRVTERPAATRAH
ncbi:MAG TPA: trypsin-like peptidase domain-containing protein [Steroidobacteraceae bacterium]|jgi:Do/DeqQ family serine protease|nr:trypsin-like peptidase domain-containing protein [Steroidobacteraceae bacterium]